MENILDNFKHSSTLYNLNNPLSLIDGIVCKLLININLFKFKNDEYYLFNIEKDLTTLLNSSMEISPNKYGLWNGPASLIYIIDLLNKVTNEKRFNVLNNLIYKKYIVKLIDFLSIHSLNRIIDIDYIYGITGLIRLMSMHSIANLDSVTIKHFDDIVGKLLNSNIFITFSHNPSDNSFYTNHNLSDNDSFIILGMAHGITGFLSAVSQWTTLHTKHQEEFLFLKVKFESLLNEMLLYYKTTYKKTIVPEIILLRENEFIYPNDNLLDFSTSNYIWCYGAIGILNYLYSSKSNISLIKELESPIISEYRASFHKHYSHKIQINHCFCHGLAGLYYYLWVHSFITPEEQDFIISQLLSYYHTSELISTDDFSLLSGNGGVLLVLLSLKYNKQFLGDDLFGFSQNVKNDF